MVLASLHNGLLCRRTLRGASRSILLLLRLRGAAGIATMLLLCAALRFQ
jgi:hypothetical protein